MVRFFPQPLTFCEFLRELSHPELSLRHQLEWCPGAHMNSSLKGPIQRPRGRRNPLLRSDFSGSGKTREQGAAEGREGAKSRVRPLATPAESSGNMAQHQKTRSRSRLRSAPGRLHRSLCSEQVGFRCSGDPSEEANSTAGLAPELLPAAIDQLWQANPLQKLPRIDWGRSRRLYRRCLPGRWQIRCTRQQWPVELSLKLWRGRG